MSSRSRKTIAEQITDLSNPAPLFDPDDEFNEEETSAKIVEGSFEEEDEDEDFHPSLESGRLRRRAAPPLEERDARYKGQRTSRKSLEVDSDEQSSDEDDTDEEADLTTFKEIMKDRQQKLSKNVKGTNEEEDDYEESSDGEDSKDEGGGDEQGDDDEGDISSKEGDGDGDGDDVDGDDDDDDRKDIYSGQIWEQLKNLKESGDDGSSDGRDISKEDEDGGSEEEDEESEEEEEAGDQSADDLDLQVMSKVNLNEEIEKGIAAKNQQGLWDNFLEARIKLQKALLLTNQLPQYTTHHSYVQMADEEHVEGIMEGQQKLKSLLKMLCKLQDELLFQNTETRHIVTGGKQKTNDSDEEIPSDDEEMETVKEKEQTDISLKRKIDLTKPGEELAKRHRGFVDYRNRVINSWYDKTKLASGKLNSKSFSAFEKSPVEQVQQIMMDKSRLLHRTQLKRSSYKVIGQSEKTVEVIPPDNEDDEQVSSVRNSQVNETDPEIFDDDDFYHQLLKELIERKTADTTDPAQLTRQWLAVQKLRSKVKRVVDTKASKGRKLRYNIHPKMVSFTAAKDETAMTDEARDELFSSLFDQARTAAVEGVS